ncbi:hypothetical protein KIPB_008912, partial [Kipferlia bialata]
PLFNLPLSLPTQLRGVPRVPAKDILGPNETELMLERKRRSREKEREKERERERGKERQAPWWQRDGILYLQGDLHEIGTSRVAEGYREREGQREIDSGSPSVERVRERETLTETCRARERQWERERERERVGDGDRLDSVIQQLAQRERESTQDGSRYAQRTMSHINDTVARASALSRQDELSAIIDRIKMLKEMTPQ